MNITIVDNDFIKELTDPNDLFNDMDFVNELIDEIDNEENFSEYSEKKSNNFEENNDLIDDDQFDFFDVSDEEMDEIFFEEKTISDFIYTRYNLNYCYSNYLINISNKEFWYNSHFRDSICIVNNSGIIIDKTIDLIDNKEIISHFTNELNEEIEKIDNLSLFDSINKLIEIHREFSQNFNKIWCSEILTIYENLTIKISNKIDFLKKTPEYKIIAQIMFMNSNDTLEKHILKIQKSLAQFSESEIELILKSFVTLINRKLDLNQKEIPFYQFKDEYYKKISTITLFHLRKLFDFIFSKKTLNFLNNKNYGKRIEYTTLIRLNKFKFSIELFNLIKLTERKENIFRYHEIEYLCNVFTNSMYFNQDRREIRKFNLWLDNELNLFLFKTFLKYASSSIFKIIPDGSFKKISSSISNKCKFQGLSSKNLLKLYVNSNDPSLNFNKKNNALILIINNQLKSKNLTIETDMIQKMLTDFKEIEKNLKINYSS